MNQQATQEQHSRPGDWLWRFWYLVPIYPYRQRRTLRTEVVKDTVWTFDQVQGIFYVVVPVRMTVIKLEAGGLLVYAPIAPTAECLQLMQELVAEHGAVKYIILPTVSGIEHKVFVGPFARQFPTAQIFVAPNQWSFPLNLPLSWLGLPTDRTQVLPEDSSRTPFGRQFTYAILGPISLGLGPFEEVAFFDRRSGTLLVTDAVVSVPKDPPEIVQLDPYPLLFHAKEDVFDPVEDDAPTRRKGWQRIALFAFYFRPHTLKVLGWREVLRNARQARDRSRKAYFGLFPFQWQEDWQQSFETLRGGGRLVVAPILQALILNRAPKETLLWANQVAGWNFQRIIPCHFDAPIAVDARQFRQAFNFLEKLSAQELAAGRANPPLPEADFALLRELDANLTKLAIVPPAKEPM